MLWPTTSICFPAVNPHDRSDIRFVHRCRSDTWCVRAGRWRSFAVSEIYGGDVFFCFQPRCHVPVSHPSHFMVQQVAALQHVTPAILIMWAKKSALEENVSGQKIWRAGESPAEETYRGSTRQSRFSDAGRDERSTCSALGTRKQIQTVSMFTTSVCSRQQQVCNMLADWVHWVNDFMFGIKMWDTKNIIQRFPAGL